MYSIHEKTQFKVYCINNLKKYYLSNKLLLKVNSYNK